MTEREKKLKSHFASERCRYLESLDTAAGVRITEALGRFGAAAFKKYSDHRPLCVAEGLRRVRSLPPLLWERTEKIQTR